MKKEPKKLIVAKVLKPQGIRGEIKVLPLTDSPDYLQAIQEVYINDAKYAIQNIRIDGSFAYLKLLGIESRDDTEKFRDKDVFTLESSLPPLPEGRYYIADIIGCKVVGGGKTFGKIYDVLQHGSVDVYCVEGEKDFMFPALEKVVGEIDIPSKTVNVDPKELAEVAVYED